MEENNITLVEEVLAVLGIHKQVWERHQEILVYGVASRENKLK